ncbi:MAG: hypothetical protein ETSY2_09015 [Candidatus Entotheonella gemina]|uniref:Uncharacterized protein n=2 Tax=Candidatus Entotheonella TaxID=93171 RepID=W4MCB9_9BACT|nr:MAG: hypothetical protein ETSY2_09015 [Candidatus Entotheonella gemina]
MLTNTAGGEFMTRIFGHPVTLVEAEQLVTEGLATEVLEKFESCLPREKIKSISWIGLSPRTLGRRQFQGRLNAVESDRLFRILSLYQQAADVFGSIEAAHEWMQNPEISLGGKTPIACAATEVGGKRVEHVLVRIADGVFT